MATRIMCERPRRPEEAANRGGLACPARAQGYPSRPLRLIVGFPPGGATDIVARLIGQWLSDRLGQPLVIENRPGAGGNISIEVRDKSDGRLVRCTFDGEGAEFCQFLADRQEFLEGR